MQHYRALSSLFVKNLSLYETSLYIPSRSDIYHLNLTSRWLGHRLGHNPRIWLLSHPEGCRRRRSVRFRRLQRRHRHHYEEGCPGQGQSDLQRWCHLQLRLRFPRNPDQVRQRSVWCDQLLLSEPFRRSVRSCKRPIPMSASALPPRLTSPILLMSLTVPLPPSMASLARANGAMLSALT